MIQHNLDTDATTPLRVVNKYELAPLPVRQCSEECFMAWIAFVIVVFDFFSLMD
jgi:hypothetical protein